MERDRHALGDREHGMLAALKNGRIWLLILIFFCIIAANSSLTFYGPTLVKEVGFTNPVTVGWIMAAAYLCGAAGMIWNGYHSDQHEELRYHCALAAALGAGSLLVVAIFLNQSAAIVLLALTLAIVGTMSAIPVFWQMPNRFLAGTAAAGGVALINSIANLAGFGAPWMLGLIKDRDRQPRTGPLCRRGGRTLRDDPDPGAVAGLPQATHRRRRAGALIPLANAAEKPDPCQPRRRRSILPRSMRWIAMALSRCSGRPSRMRRGWPQPHGRRVPLPAWRRCMPRCSTSSGRHRRTKSSPSSAVILSWPAAKPQAGTMTAESVGEQNSAGLNALTGAEIEDMQRLNRAYRERHGFPFIIAVRANTKQQIFAAMRARTAQSTEVERDAALEQIGLITRGRIDALVNG